MFGSVIADRIYAMEQATAGSGVAWIKSFGFFNNNYYATDEGSIQSAKPSAHRTTGKNLINIPDSIKLTGSNYNVIFNKDLNGYITESGSDGRTWSYSNSQYKFTLPKGSYKMIYDVGSSSSTNFDDIRILTDTNKTLIKLASTPFSQTGAHTSSIFTLEQTTQLGLMLKIGISGNVRIMIVVSTDTDTTYKSYEQWVYPLADTELRGIPKLDSNNNLYFDGDVYYPNGDVVRRYGVVDLGTLTWTYDSTNTRFSTVGITSSAKALAVVICQKYTNDYSGITGSTNNVCAVGQNKDLFVRDTSYGTDATAFKTAMNGVYLIYELATPTKETVAGYTNPHTLIRKGAEEFIDNRTIALPVGHETEYVQLPSWLSNNVIFL
jgi:hypothetical protein